MVNTIWKVKKSMLKYCSLLIDTHTLDLSTSDGVLVGAFIEHVCTEGDILRSVHCGEFMDVAKPAHTERIISPDIHLC